MLSNLSFKTKLFILLITAITGLIIVTAVAMTGLSSQQSANNELRNLSKIQASNDQLSIHMLEIADSLRSISVENYQDYIASAKEQIAQNANIIATNIEKAHSQNLKQTLEENLVELND
jgi:methyl-accepting chemotaxis protein